MNTLSKTLPWLAILAMFVTGAIHVIDAPDAFGEAAYKGALFIANGIGALVAAIGVFRGSKSWGWGLGLVIAVGSILAYVASRTVGLPQIEAEPDAWFETAGVISLIAEGVFAVIALRALASRAEMSAMRAA